MIIIHPFINQRGGAEKVCVRMIDALHRAGHEVTLYTIEKTDWEPIESDWGIERRPKEFWYFEDQRYLRLPLIRWPIFLFLYFALLIKAAKKNDCVTLNNFGEIFPLFADACYIHSLPLSESINDNPYDIPLWGALKPLYQTLLRLLSNHTSGLILTNSKYNACKIKAHTKSRTVVLYPPVDKNEASPTPKTPSILNASRLSRSKNLGIIPKIATEVTALCGFNICITTRNPDEANISHLQGPNIDIIPNPPRERLNKLYQTSTIYLSTQPTEAFGLSILEAMGAGCIPLVPRDGGPWYDILDERQGEIGFAYDTPREAAQHIDEILKNRTLAEELGKAAANRAKHYQEPHFFTDLPRILEEIQATKGRNL